MPADDRLRCRLNADAKRRFEALSAARGQTPSELLRQLVGHALADQVPTTSVAQKSSRPGPRSERVSLRLRASDVALVDRRSAARGMTRATYLAQVVRAHLRHDPPLPVDELAEVRRALGQVAEIGYTLRMLQRSDMCQAASDLTLAIRRIEDVREAVASLVRANATSWDGADE